MRNLRFSRACALSACATLLAQTVSIHAVHAEPASPEAEPPAASASAPEDGRLLDARQAFRDGSALARRARWDEALAAFERSYALHAHPVTSYNIAYCERAVGHYTRAYVALERTLREHGSGTLGTLPPELERSARAYRTEIEERVARIQVVVKPSTAKLLVDGQALETVELGNGTRVALAGTREDSTAELAPGAHFELWLDPGSHVFVASHGAGSETVATARYAPRARGVLELVVRSPGDQATANAAGSSKPPNRMLGYVALGVGAAGLVTAGVTGALALRKKSELNDACGTNRADCPPESQSDIDAMNRFADVSTIGFIAGLVAGGAGIVLLATAPPSKEGPPSASYGLVLGAGSARFTGRF